MKAWIVWRQLTWAQRRTVVLALVLVPLFALRLRSTSLPAVLSRWQGEKEALGPRLRGDDGGREEAVAIARAVALVAGRLGATCLTRSLALRWILARRDIATVLRLGVHNKSGGLHAHAWLECRGVPLNDTVEATRGFAPVHLP
jgi:hypothetical protein